MAALGRKLQEARVPGAELGVHEVSGPSRLGSRFWILGRSLVVQWLGLCTFTTEGAGLIPGQGTKIPQATWRS